MEDVGLRKPGRKTNKVEAVKPLDATREEKNIIMEDRNPGPAVENRAIGKVLNGKNVIIDILGAMSKQLTAIKKFLLCSLLNKGKLGLFLTLSVGLTVVLAIVLIVVIPFVGYQSKSITYVGIPAYIFGLVSYFLIILHGRQSDMKKKKS